MSSAVSTSSSHAGWHCDNALGWSVLIEDSWAGTPPAQEGGIGEPATISSQPVAVHGSDGGPVLSMVVVLQRPPTPDQQSVVPLICSSTLSFDVALGLTDEDLAALSARYSKQHRRLFMDRVDYRLGYAPGNVRVPVLAQTSAQGTVGRAALSASLGREDTLDVLAALRGSPSRLIVEADACYSRPGSPQTVRIRGNWAEIWDALSERATDSINIDGFGRAIRMLITHQRLTIASAEKVDPDEVARIVLAQSAVVLDRSNPTSWQLRNRPHPAVPLDYEASLSSRRTSVLSLSAPLDRILSEPLRGLAIEPYVSLVAPQPNGSLETVAPKSAQRNSRTDGKSDIDQVLAVHEDQLKSVALIAQPRRVSTASSVFLASTVVRPATIINRPTSLGHLALDDTRIISPTIRPESMPVVENPETGIWPDRTESKFRWYAPQTELVLPDPTIAAESSPFLFEFRRTGVTDDSRPALEATIKLTVRRVVPPGASIAEKGQSIREVPVQGVAAALEVPFIDRVDGTLKYQALEGIVTPTESGWTIKFRVVNDWVRICYRALSGVASAEPALLRLDYTFAGYTLLRRGNWQIGLKPSTAILPVVFAPRDLDSARLQPMFDARALTLRTPDADINFRREDPASVDMQKVGASRSPSELFTQDQVSNRAEARAPNNAHTALENIAAHRPVAMLRPTLRPRPLPIVPSDVTYAKRTFARRLTIQTQLPCATFGRLYLEATSSGNTAVGCRDELQLGETRYAIFSEIPSLRTEHWSVHQLLQQPGRFLIFPISYGITRHEADEGAMAYRPCVVLYAVLDPNSPDNNRIQLDATLQPDIGTDARDDLMVKLGELDSQPQLLLPTEIEGVRAEFQWGLPSSEIIITTTVLPGGLIRVGIACSIPDWLLVRTQLQSASLSGTAVFNYPDGTSLRTALTLNLTRVLGPWGTGPVEVDLTDGHAVLTNRTERTVDVKEIICSALDGRTRVPVAETLSPGEKKEVPVPRATIAAVPAVSLPKSGPITIEESRSFVDSLETNVIFVNLIALEARGLTRLSVDARIRGVQGEQNAQLTDTVSTVELRFTLPLTTYLSVRMLEYRLTAHDADGTSTTGEWTQWDLATQGNIVGLTWNQAEPVSDNN